MKLSTPVQIMPSPRQLSHGEGIISLGSCFCEHIGQYLKDQGHRIEINPFGTVYNPLSIHTVLSRLMQRDKPYTADELFEYEGLYHSWHHHGRFSSPDANESLRLINEALGRASDLLPKAQYLLITWGTAFVYRLKDSGMVVTNCHKLPEKQFERRLCSVEELRAEWVPLLSQLLEQYPQLQIISTVSPIRHLRDGAHPNQLSKATLLLFDEELRQQFPDRIAYFPAYEIVMDELRDYRFYAEDMTHPSSLTIKIIAERFVDWFCTPKAKQIGGELQQLLRGWGHRSLHPSEADTRRRDLLEQRLRDFAKAHPEVCLPEQALIPPTTEHK